MMCKNLLVIFVTICLIVTGSEGNRLNDYIKHYEPLSYDSDALMDEHTRLTRSASGPSHLQLHFSALGRSFKLRLYQGSPSLTSNAVVMVDDKPVTHYKSLLYHGVDEDDSSVRVHGNMARGVFSGQIHTSDETYFIEPSSRYVRGTEAHSVIYRSSDVVMPEGGGTCGHSNEDIYKHLAKKSTITKSQKRVTRQSNSTNTRCELKVIADDQYYNMITSELGNDPSLKQAVVISFMTAYVDAVREIYERTNFGGQLGITFAIANLIVETEPSPPFDRPNLGVEAFLDFHSQADYSDFCLSYRFTARDFDGGVLGLAYIGKLPNSGSVGGICENVRPGPQTLNTGIVTIVNYDREVPQLVVQLTFAHEIGHNFGSEHDMTTSCSPGDENGGNYIMFPHASTGSQPNNDDFSECSRDVMTRLITGKGQDAMDGCFTANEGAICGNEIVEDGEECDCGRDASGDFNIDPCCDCPSCTLPVSIVCSPSQGPCCSSSCQLLTSTTVCQAETECQEQSVCNGINFTCPTPASRDRPCDSNRSYCENGTCTGSYCIALGLEGCECSAKDEKCSVCCYVNGTCTSTTVLANLPQYATLLPDDGLTTAPGGVCNDNEGYCDFLGNCRPTASEGALSRLAGALFGSDAVDTVIEWVEDMWWAVLLIALGVLLFLFAIVFFVQLILPTPAHVKARKERQKQAKGRS